MMTTTKGYLFDLETKGLMGEFICAGVLDRSTNEFTQYTNKQGFVDWLTSLPDGMVLWAHNVSYEYEYLRNVLKVTVDRFTWKCTQVLAHCVHKDFSSDRVSLDYLSYELNTEHKKLDIAIDWEQPLTPELFNEVLVYNRNDVLAANELIPKLVQLNAHKLMPDGSLVPLPEKIRKRKLELLLKYFDLRMRFYIDTVIPMIRTGLTMRTATVDSIQKDIQELESTFSYVFLPVYEKGKPIVKHYKHSKTRDYGVHTHPNHPNTHYRDYNGVLIASTPTTVYDHCPVDRSLLTSNTKQNVVDYLRGNGLGNYINDKGNVDTKSIPEDTDNPILIGISKGVRLNTMSGYLKNYLKLAKFNDTGDYFQLHSFFNINGTRTGRLSSSKPNLQNIGGSNLSSHADVASIQKRMRSLVTARPGYTFISGDIDKAELVILGKILSKWDNGEYQELLNNPDSDIHAFNANKWGLTRLDAKRLVFSVIYGATEFRVAEVMGTTSAKAKEALNNILTGLPALGQAIAYYRTQCSLLGGVYDLFGDFKSYPDYFSNDMKLQKAAERQLFNAVIQGTNGSLMAWLCPELHRVSLDESGGHIVAIVHDEILIEVPTNRVEKVLDSLNNFCNNKYDVPYLEGSRFNIEFKKGDNWLLTK